jgi:hypothetical protein
MGQANSEGNEANPRPRGLRRTTLFRPRSCSRSVTKTDTLANNLIWYKQIKIFIKIFLLMLSVLLYRMLYEPVFSTTDPQAHTMRFVLILLAVVSYDQMSLASFTTRVSQTCRVSSKCILLYFHVTNILKKYHNVRNRSTTYSLYTRTLIISFYCNHNTS